MNKQAWEKVVYILIYPAVLGSMIYDLSDLITFSEYSNLQKLALFLVVAIYLADFVTNRGVISDGQNTYYGMVVDVSAAVCFRYAFSNIAIEDYKTALWIFALITALFLTYNYFIDKKVRFSLEIIVTFLILICLTGLTHIISNSWSLMILLFAQCAILVAYVLYLSKQKKSPTV